MQKSEINAHLVFQLYKDESAKMNAMDQNIYPFLFITLILAKGINCDYGILRHINLKSCPSRNSWPAIRYKLVNIR